MSTPAEGATASTMAHGTQLVREDGRLVAVIDRGGVTHARMAWRGARLARLIVGEPGRWTIVGGEEMAHPLFVQAHPVWVTSGEEPGDVSAVAPATWMGPVDWAAPERVPPTLAPGRLRAGAGTMILNVIALLADAAGIQRLAYAGPYPTSVLWRSLAHSFRVVGGATEDDFTTDALGRSVRGAMEPVPVGFAPAPFERVRIDDRVTVQLRGGLERATIDGVGFDRADRTRRLVAIADGPRRWAAELWLGERAWGRVAELDDDGHLLAGPAALPAVGGGLAAMLGQPLPPAMCAALAEVVAELVAPPLAEAARRELAAARVVWGDPGATEVADRADVLIVHAGLWAHLAPHGLPAVARGLALALAAPIAARAQARLLALATAG